MAGTAVLSKILHIRENEKKEVQQEYQQSIAFFEQTATNLYELLREKEKAEETHENFFQQPTSIERIRDQALYIEKMNNKINQMQFDVQQARNKMESKQEQLTDAHVEVKKFEKILEHRHEQQRKMTSKTENEQMNEISIQQYLDQKNG